MFNSILETVKTAATAASSHHENQNVEEPIGKLDSQGGKVQVSTVQDEKKVDKSSEILSGLMNVAQAVGKSMEEHKMHNPPAPDVEETIGKVDAQGGKVQVSTVQDEPKAEPEAPKANDFLSNLVHFGQDIGNAVGKGLAEQKQHTLPTPAPDAPKANDFMSSLSGLSSIAQDLGKAFQKEPEPKIEVVKKPDPSKMTDADLKVLGENIGSIVGGIFKKEEPKVATFKSEAIIDDVEGEIGKVTTSGYTSHVQKQL